MSSKPFVLREEESLEEAFHRIADDQLTRAAGALTSGDDSYEERIHDIRKRFKESRALLRLYRAALGDAFAERNRWYRDTARSLAPYRDSTAILEALKALPAAIRHEIGRGPMTKLRRLARERCGALYADQAAVERMFGAVAQEIEAERARTAALRLNDADAAVEEGFARTLSAGRKAMRTAHTTADETAVHEWRKRVKDQWYHVQIFVPVWPELMAAREHALDNLAHLLGDHHDLAVVRAHVEAARFRKRDAVSRISAILAERQKAIAEEAWPIAEKVFAARPRAEARETLELWRAWHTTVMLSRNDGEASQTT